MNRNLGATRLRRKRRAIDPMHVYDGLPTPVRQWLSQAALPWSPVSAQKIWKRAQAKGLCPEDALALLRRAESHTLARDKGVTRQPVQSAK